MGGGSFARYQLRIEHNIRILYHLIILTFFVSSCFFIVYYVHFEFAIQNVQLCMCECVFYKGWYV